MYRYPIRFDRFFRLVSLLAAGWLFCRCGYDDHTPETVLNDTSDPTVPISELHRHYEMGGVTTYDFDHIVSGVVVASDKSGNFYRTFVIEDGSGGVEIKAGLYDLNVLYPVGRRVSVSLKGLTLGMYNGIHQLGLYALPSSGYEVEFFQASAVMDRFVRRGEMELMEPEIVAVEELNDAHLGRLVKIENVRYLRTDTVSWAGHDYPGDLPFGRDEEERITVYTSQYASFAGDTVPSGRVSLTGVVMKNNRRYRIKLREIEDVEILD